MPWAAQAPEHSWSTDTSLLKGVHPVKTFWTDDYFNLPEISVREIKAFEGNQLSISHILLNGRISINWNVGNLKT